MNPARYEQVRQVFLSACELGPLEQQRLLDDRCADDPELRAAVDALLAKDEVVGQDVRVAPEENVLAAEAVDRLTETFSGKAPEMIGRYRIVRTIAHGGMGAVYEAVQDSPHRTVALKVIRPGLATPKVVRRFEYEAQILGLLRHPNIAQIHEASMAETTLGMQPFFAMEYVEGLSILEHVRAHELDARGRLELLLPIYEAVQYAHQKGVIHRDLKPGNILVDESGCPKILDFGVARATDLDVQATTLKTNFGELVGTVPYMSPEQVGGDPAQIDTRSDIYALGVLTFQLLVDRLPFEAHDKQLMELLHEIRDVDAPRLGTLDRSFRGDLETIVAKSLEKEKTRRYPTAAALDSDVRRYLQNEPIEARPATRTYRLSKFVRRNRGLVAGMAAALLILVAGTVATSVGMAQAVRREAQANEARDEAEGITQFLVEMLESADPEALGRDVLVRDILDDAAASLQADATADRPLTEARLQYALGRAYRQLGEQHAARAHLEAAYATRKAMLGADHTDTRAAGDMLGAVLRVLGQYEDAEHLHRKNHAIEQRLFGLEDKRTLNSAHNLGLVYAQWGKYEQAEALLSRTYQARRAVLGQRDPETLASMLHLAATLFDRGQFDASQRLAEHHLELCRQVYGEDHLKTMESLESLAAVHYERGQLQRAEDIYRRLLTPSPERWGDRHRRTLLRMRNLAVVYKEQGEPQRAESLLRDALDTSSDAFGDRHPDTLVIRSTLCANWIAQRDYQAAIAELRDVLRLQREISGATHPRTLETMSILGQAYLETDKLLEAETLYLDVLAARVRVLGEEHHRTVATQQSLAMLYYQEKDYERAYVFLAQVLEFQQQNLGVADPETLNSMRMLGQIQTAMGQYDQARQTFERAVALGTSYLGNHPIVLYCQAGLATLFAREQDLDGAVELYTMVLEQARRQLGEQDLLTMSVMTGLGDAFMEQGKFSEAETVLLEVHGALVRALGDDHPSAQRTAQSLSQIYNHWQRPSLAAQYREASQPRAAAAANN